MQWKDRWHIYGDFKQYSPKQLRLWQVESVNEEFPSCFLGHLQYIMNHKHLAVYDYLKKTHQDIYWPEAASYLQEIHQGTGNMKATELSENILLLQAGNILLYIQNGTVGQTIQHQGELMVINNVATWVGNGVITIYTFEEETINFHGEMEMFDGHFYGAVLNQDTIMMLFYDYREIKVRIIHLVSKEDN